MFGDLYEFVFATPITSFAQFDSEGPLRRVMSPEDRAVLLRRLDRCVNGRHRYAVRLRSDLSIIKESESPPNLAVVTTVDVARGKQAEFEAMLKGDILPAFQKLDVDGFWTHQTVFGGSNDRWVFVSLLKNYADLDKGPWLARALGEEGARKMGVKAAGITTSFTQTLSRPMPELSYEP